MTQTNTKQNSNVPTLRFPEFDGEWEEKKIGQLGSFTKGKGISKSDIDNKGNTPCIRYGELYTEYGIVIDTPISRTALKSENLKLSCGGEILIPSSGESAIDIATASVVLNSGIALGGDINIFSTKQDGVFIASYLSSKKRTKLAALAQGNSVVHLYGTHIIAINIFLPKIKEQQKTASFLTAVDEKIELLSSKKALLEDYKKGAMQKLFSQQIRFKDDNGNNFPDWEEKKLGDIAVFKKGKGISKADIKMNGANKCIRYGELYTTYNEIINRIISKTNTDLNSAVLSQKNDILMPTSDVTPNGLAKASALDECGVILGGDILIIRSKEILNSFFSYLISSNKKMIMRLVSGVTVYHIYGSDMETLKLNLPNLNEQRKIADFLSTIDDKIKHTNNQLEQAKDFKKGLLQQMFV